MPASFLLTKEMIFSSDNKPNLQLLRNHFTRQGKLSTDAAIELVSRARSIFDKEPNMLTLDVPIFSIQVFIIFFSLW